jgi:hypothetical protein
VDNFCCKKLHVDRKRRKYGQESVKQAHVNLIYRGLPDRKASVSLIASEERKE